MSNEEKVKIHSPALISQMFMPTTHADAMAFCERCSKEDFIPTQMKGKPMTIFLAWQMGVSVGLDFFAAIQNIAVINGRPSIYGDAALAVIMNHNKFVSHREWPEGSIEAGDLTWYCGIILKDNPNEIIRSFSIKQAMRAGLWEKAGPWKNYPDRMLQMRARGFCMRDSIPGALKGLSIREEVIDLPPEDYYVIENKETPKLGIEAVKQTVTKSSSPPNKEVKVEVAEANVNSEEKEVIDNELAAPTFDQVKAQMEAAQSVDDLIMASDLARCINKTKEQHEELAKIYKRKHIEVNSLL